jgi:hypothetical protein
MAKQTQDYENVTPITAEEQQAEILMNEAEILKALTDPTQHDDRTEVIEVTFGKAVFRFRIRPLSEKEWDRCRERSTKYAKNRRLGGMRLPESTDTVGYHSLLIYTATVDEDKRKLWDNQAFWTACNVVTGVDMVDRLIPYAGKKAQIIERIEALSGYDEEEASDYEGTVKNS